MASDDDMIDEEDLDSEGFIEEDDPEVDIDEIDEDDLDGEIDELDEDDAEGAVDEDEEETASVARPKRATEDEDEELLAADDVEEDLAKILDERLLRRSEEGEEDQEEEEELPSVADPETSIQPKRPDERMCPQCFLLVRKGAPVCPVGDDTCPLFS